MVAAIRRERSDRDNIFCLFMYNACSMRMDGRVGRWPSLIRWGWATVSIISGTMDDCRWLQ